MRWRKLGRVFDPATVRLPGGAGQFAQAPQALVLDDLVRIFFSTRSVDENGKYRSHVVFIDMDRSLRRVIDVCREAVMPLGEHGCFDEHGIFPLSVLRHGDALYGYTCGWSRRVSVSVETAIGLAISHDDGVTFVRTGKGPVLTASLNEPCLVGDGFVRVVGDTFHMWYIFGLGWKRYAPGGAPDRIYKIGHATSADGVTWTKEGRPIIADRLGADESQALPCVIEIDGLFHLFFCYRHSFDFRTNPSRGYRIGHAFSDDLSTWTRADDDPALVGTPGQWDSDMQCYPHAFACDGAVLLLYNGNEFGRHGFGAAVLER